MARRRRRHRSGLRRFVDWSVLVMMLGGLAFFVAWLETRNPSILSGTVRVVDGDSLIVDGEKVRLKGIDAPEFDQLCQRNGDEWRCGRRSRDALKALVRKGKVVCRAGSIDRYDRWLGTCEAGGVEINRTLVESGWAVDYGGYADAENRARIGDKGIWAGTFERPQKWRRAHKGDAGSNEGLRGAVNTFWGMLRAMKRRLFG